MEHRLRYISFPLLLHVRCWRNEKMKFNVLGGILFDKVIRYDRISYYHDKPTRYERKLNVLTQLGLSFRGGMSISRKMGDNFELNTDIFLDYKLIQNAIDAYQGSNLTVPDYRLRVGISIGSAYYF